MKIQHLFPLSLGLILVLLPLATPAQNAPEYLATTFVEGKPLRLPLWPDGAPNSNGIDYTNYQRHADPQKAEFLQRILHPDPELFVYLPEGAGKDGRQRKCIVACPGGAYICVVMHQEGLLWHDFFTREDIVYVVLGYRVPQGHPEVPASDVYQAIRLVQAHAEEWGVDPAQIGVMGSSAGGHLASTVATHAPDDVRPAFQILFYPVITMDASLTHAGSRQELLGNHPTDEQVRLYSNELQVSATTPRALILLAADDDVVPPLNALHYYEALLTAQVPASLHIYPTGGHGFGAQQSFRYHLEMAQEIRTWLHSF